MLRNRSQRSPALTTLSDLDDQREADICIGLPDGPGGRFRVLQRMRSTPRQAALAAARTASLLAGATREQVLDPSGRPAAVRVSDRSDGWWIWLDYDVGVVDQLGGSPRASRPLRIVLRATRPA